MMDLRYAFRTLFKSPGFTIVAILTLALGIGVNSAIFSVVNGVLLKPLRYQNPRQLVWIWSTRKDVSRAFYSIPNFVDTRAQTQTIDKLIAFATWGINLAGPETTERLQGIRITADAFDILGARAVAGRILQSYDEKPESERVVMISEGLWQRKFGRDPKMIGQTLRLNGESYTVVGILPRDLVIPNAEVELATPLRPEVDPRRSERGSNFLRVMARLKSGVTPEQTRLELAAISERLRERYPDDNANLSAPRVLPLQDELVGSYRQGLIVLLVAVGIVLLIACSNLANLQLARAAARSREIAIRTALGATRWHLLRQLLTEGMLVALIGGAGGLLLAAWGKDLLLSLAPADFPRASAVSIDVPVLLFCLGVSVFAGLALGLAPAAYALKGNLNCDLKDGGRTDSGNRQRGRSVLIITEIALSLVLLVGTGLIIKSFARLTQVNPGFSANHAVAVRLSLPPTTYSSGDVVKTLYDKLAARLGALPGVESVAAASALPMSGLTARTEFKISGREIAKPSDVPSAQHRWVSRGYFATMKIPLLRGRDFTDYDQAQSAGVIIVDQALSHRFFADVDPIGAHIFITMGDNMPAREYEIVGVAENVKHNSLGEEPLPTFYGPMAQAPKSAVPFLAGNFSIIVRSGINPQVLAAGVRKELRDLDPGIALSNVQPMSRFLAASVAPRKFNMVLLATFAGTALLLAGIGLYAVIAFIVSNRTREIGVRMALGAQRRDVLSLVLGYGFKLVIIGLIAGVIGAFGATRLLSSLIFNTSTTDPVTYIGVALLLVLVALIACYLPARRAMKVDPIVALRYE
jgi:predicted permease